jgi:hypothetical protein
MISHEKKFVFVHIPRTGGTHLKKILEPYSNNPDVIPIDNCLTTFNEWAHHKSISTYLSYLSENRNQFKDSLESILTEYNFFTIIRNPWERALSYALHENDGIFEREKFREVLFNGTTGFGGHWGGLDDWRAHLINPHKKPTHKKWPLSIISFLSLNETLEFCYFTHGFRINSKFFDSLNYIRYENYYKEIPSLLDDLKIDYNKEDFKRKTNATNHKHYSHYYLDDEIEYVGKICSLDIKLFGYEFEDRRALIKLNKRFFQG